MRVFLDTNVLVSAFATRGLCADILRETLAEHDLCTGDVVLEELRRVLSQKLGLPARLVADMVALLSRGHVEPRPDDPPNFPFPLADPDDAWVLASALAAGAGVLVTGDDDLLSIKDLVSDLVITNPRGFWNLLRAQQASGSS